MTPMDNPALECRDVTVAYGSVMALSGVGIAFEQGKIHAVVGQNGAGKTTFARVAAGLVRPAAGELRINGQQVKTGKVKDARAAGVELVHQSFALPPSFTVAEAMEFGSDRGAAIFTRSALQKRWAPHLKSLDVNVDPKRRVRDLPVETQQGIEIARALVADARVLILDEPTAVLSPSGIEMLFERVRKLRDRGVTVILILHKIREVLAIADTVSVLRGGRLVDGPAACAEIGAKRLAEMIVGPAVARTLAPGDADAATGRGAPAAHTANHHTPADAGLVLDMRGVSTQSDAEGPALRDLSLTIKAGEIVGIAGVEGNGQRTLVRAIADLVDAMHGTLAVGGVDVTAAPLARRRAAGLRIIPFERNTEGLSLSSSLWENWSARELLQSRLLSAINPARLKKRCDEALQAWSVHYATTGQQAGSLSGGNAQKVILAREVDADAKLIIAAQPTRGLDIGATAFVWQSLREARDRGCGVLLISSDLDELFDISDRVVVMLSGEVAGTFSAPYRIGAVGAAMTGVSQ
ncbi:ABC transporter ATP-binding protein [Mesorhizobium sp. WSM4312]|nr:ABC transporter ATP-binding protein [Mesorhizobium sp. WSM4312]